MAMLDLGESIGGAINVATGSYGTEIFQVEGHV